jgi:hypothetical protein
MALRRKTLVMGGIAVAVVSCCGLGSLILLGILVAPGVEKASREADKAGGKVPWAQAAVPLKSELTRLHGKVPAPPALVSKSCPDAEIQKNYKEAPGKGLQGEVVLWLSSVPYELLERWLAKGLEPRDHDPWLWLTDLVTAQLMDPARYEGYWFEEDMARELRAFHDRRYLAVFRAEERALPRVTGDPETLGLLGRRGRLEKANGFQTGRFRGWIVVMDVETGEPVCQAPVQAENSETLEYWTRGPFKKDPQVLVEGDFRERLDESSRRALAGISKVLKLMIRR